MRGVREKGVGLLEEGRDRWILSALDFQFAARLARLYGEQAVEVIWGLAIACRKESRGHVCADLPRLEVTGLTAEIEGEVRHSAAVPGDSTLESWLDLLRGSSDPFGARSASHASSHTPADSPTGRRCSGPSLR